MKQRKEKSKTLTTYKRLKGAKYGLYAGTFACPLIPATIVTAVNWEEWFNKSGMSLPLGFACLMLSVVIAVVGVLKSETVFSKIDVALYCLAGFVACVGLSCMFLASLFTQMGAMWLYTASGILGSGVCITVENRAIEPELKFYKGLIEENCLDYKSKKRKEREERARAEAEAEARRQAID